MRRVGAASRATDDDRAPSVCDIRDETARDRARARHRADAPTRARARWTTTATTRRCSAPTRASRGRTSARTTAKRRRRGRTRDGARAATERTRRATKRRGNARAGVEIEGLDDDDHRFNARTLWRFMGPGFLMCIAYVDPGNFESDLQAGTLFGYKLLWVLLWATLGGWYIQGLTIRLALATGWDLARCMREEYPDPARYALWAMTELAIIASDVPEVIGTALALKLIFGIPTWVGVVLTSMSTMVFLGVAVVRGAEVGGVHGGARGRDVVVFLG